MWVETAGQPEIPLAGGDVTEGVVRIGKTVRRPVGPHSPLVHALLAHLESADFEGAPRFLGIDASGREVLSYIDGEVAGRPRPSWIADETRLASVGRLVRAYDDAAASFTPPPDTLPGTRPAEPAGVPPAPAYPPELIGHVDITPENVVFRDGRAYALIDFDLAKPATRADEMFNAMMKQRAQTQGGGWQRMWDEGVGDVIKRREAWLDRHAATLTAALTTP
jgi:Phosphotransferase enzyme family